MTDSFTLPFASTCSDCRLEIITCGILRSVREKKGKNNANNAMNTEGLNDTQQADSSTLTPQYGVFSPSPSA